MNIDDEWIIVNEVVSSYLGIFKILKIARNRLRYVKSVIYTVFWSSQEDEACAIPVQKWIWIIYQDRRLREPTHSGVNAFIIYNRRVLTIRASSKPGKKKELDLTFSGHWKTFVAFANNEYFFFFFFFGLATLHILYGIWKLEFYSNTNIL